MDQRTLQLMGLLERWDQARRLPDSYRSKWAILAVAKRNVLDAVRAL